jgi:UDP:flavonoid glycosyltransferase YjiC (YdhE family)
MRILLTSRGSSGHLTPMAPFAHAAVRAGHQVLVAVQENHEGNAHRLGLPSTGLPAPPPQTWMPLMASFATLELRPAHEAMIREYFGRLDTTAALPALHRLVDEWRPDLIVRESWEFASTIVGEQLGVPVVRVGLGVASIEEMTDELVQPVLDPIRVSAGLPADPAGRALRDTPYLTMVPGALEPKDAPVPQLAQRFRHAARNDELDVPAAWWPGAEDAPLVYASFGSVTGGAQLPYFPELYRRAIAALAELPARILLTLGEDPDPAALGPVPENVHVERWVPQDAVLAQAAAFVNHGGFGSTLGALAHGVPTVVLPLFSLDQWANAAAVAYAGAGIALDGDMATRHVLALPDAEVLAGLGPAVERVLADRSYAEAARGVAAAMAALPGPDRAVACLLDAGFASLA